jgi:hypothetical protein
MLVEVEQGRTLGRVPGEQARLLERLADGCVLRTLAGLDVPAGLEPAVEAPVQVQEDATRVLVDDDRRGGHVRGKGRPRVGVLVTRQQAAKVRDRVPLLDVERRTRGEQAEEGQRPRVVEVLAQLRTCLLRTAPVLSSS